MLAPFSPPSPNTCTYDIVLISSPDLVVVIVVVVTSIVEGWVVVVVESIVGVWLVKGLVMANVWDWELVEEGFGSAGGTAITAGRDGVEGLDREVGVGRCKVDTFGTD